jgi:hypothetical protein
VTQAGSSTFTGLGQAGLPLLLHEPYRRELTVPRAVETITRVDEWSAPDSARRSGTSFIVMLAAPRP